VLVEGVVKEGARICGGIAAGFGGSIKKQSGGSTGSSSRSLAPMSK